MLSAGLVSHGAGRVPGQPALGSGGDAVRGLKPCFHGFGALWGFGLPLAAGAWCGGVPQAVLKHPVALPLSCGVELSPSRWNAWECAGDEVTWSAGCVGAGPVVCWSLDTVGRLGHCRFVIGAWLWWGDGWLMGPLNHRLLRSRDRDLPPRHTGRHGSVHGVLRAQAPSAEEEIFPLLAVGASDEPHGPFRIPHQPTDSEGKAGVEGDSECPAVSNVHGIRVPGVRSFAAEG